MKRRNFLKYLSSIPLIGIPAKLLAKEQVAKQIIPVVSPEFQKQLLRTAKSKALYFKGDPYADVEHISWGYPKTDPVPDDAVSLAEERNTDWNQVIASNRVGKDNAVVHDLYKALMENHTKI